MADETTEIRGPYLSYALLCEKVLREADGTLSFIRVVDRVNLAVQAAGPTGLGLPTITAVPVVALTLVVGLKSGAARGTRHLKLWIDSPSGFKYPEMNVEVSFEGDDDRGVNLILPLQFPAQDPGLYWFVVSLDEGVLTKVPLRISRQTTTQLIPPQLPM
jgi:hypothetical protein